jgi:transcriptional regulator with XRE-family HTH domain
VDSEGLSKHSEDFLDSAEELGEKIRRLRSERGLAQERLAIEAHIDQSGLSKFERGRDRRLSKQSLERIATVLGLSYEDLLEGTDYGVS